MGRGIVCFLLMRIILPACLLSSVIIRPIGISLIYLLLLFYIPFVPVPSVKSIRGHAGHYLRAVLCISTLTLLVQIAWQITLASVPYDWSADWIKPCGLIEKILRHSGFVPYESLSFVLVLKWISPEILMFVSSVSIYFLCSTLCKGLPDTETQASAPKRKGTFLVSVGKYLSLFLLMLSGCLRPSILSGIYYLTFLGGATWWACGKELSRGYAIVSKCIMTILFFHITLLYVYQVEWILDLLPPASPYARYFGFTKLIAMDCVKKPYSFEYLPIEWPSFASPVMLVLLYHILAFESAELLKPQVTPIFEEARATESTPLIRAVSPTRKFLSRKSNASSSIYYQDSTGSVTVAPDEDANKEGDKPSIIEHIIFSIASIFQMLIRSSYIATAIIMMAWSITYHSWLAFVLLLWANVIWMVQDQRGFTLRSSPFLVIYAQLLLLAQYIYGMDITENELPFQVKGMNMAQIGFERRLYLPCIPILVKSLYTIMFWVTLRQLMQERKEKKQSSAIADMVAPLQVTVGPATAVLEDEQPMQTSPLLKKLGELVKGFLTKFWICVVATMLFVIGITGQRMTVFRIMYMALFLIFILTFQISRQAWRKMMYGFWVTVIVYSMSILILVYTYQFDNFPDYWEKYLRISRTLQLDIGLELYETKELFLRLLTPTLFLILTVVQLHYFHKDFLAVSHVKSRSSSVARQDSQGPHSIASSMMGGSSLPPSTPMEKTTNESFEVKLVAKNSEQDIHNKSESHTHLSSKLDFLTWITRFQKILLNVIRKVLDFVFLFLELHLIKFIFLCTMLLCVLNVCAIHVAFVFIICIGLLFSSKVQLVLIHFISTATCILLLCKMIYQIEYIEHQSYNVNCTFHNASDPEDVEEVILNNAEWLGFNKTGSQYSLPQLVKGYICLITVITIRAIVEFRQSISRYNKQDPTIRPHLMFPHVTRADADKDIHHLLKYLFNFGFYKFGVEVCLMCVVGVIGSRMDVWAVLYSGWLCVLWCSSRERLLRLWKWFVGYIVIVLPVQYILVVDFLPEFCVQYPWMNADEILQRARDWMMLPDPTHKPHAEKLICDFILLLLCSRQSLVFRIEQRHGRNYKGGSNAEFVPNNWESQDFENPVPDFVTYMRSWLDAIKRIAFMGSLWVTLAIMFLTGTNRVNLFSLGYLVGSFVFLWQGTDLYLRPIQSTLKWWNWLLGYNVTVIVIKAVLQILGCIFIEIMQNNVCWLVQLLGIGCIDKFSGKSIKTFFKMQGPVIEHECSVPREDIGLAWDGVCFGFLLMQRRLFQSHYFLRIINECKAITILQSRGAELIEELRTKQMSLQDEQEKKILEKIKVKMDRIKANQQKIQGPAYKDPSNHFVDDIFPPDSRPSFQKQYPSSYKSAIRSGDYYMFDEFDDEEELDLISEKDSDDNDDDKKLTLGEQTTADPENVVLLDKGDDGGSEPSDQVLDSKSDTDPEKQTLWRKLCTYFLFAWAFVESFLISLTRWLNKFSRDYRYVAKVLTREKILLKERVDFGIGIRSGSPEIWEPLPSTLMRLKKPRSSDASIYDEQNLEASPSSAYVKKISESTTPIEEYDDETFASDQPTIFRFLFAVWYAILAHTDIVCYFMIFINQIQSAAILSLPLPLMVFLWGTLSIPRPSKTFWVTIIAYTEVIVLVKSMFQYEILWWNQNVIPTNMPFSAPRIIGIERKHNYALYDLILLLIVFFHRYMLISLGLWKSTPPPEEPDDKTYPVTQDEMNLINEGKKLAVGQIFAKKHAEEKKLPLFQTSPFDRTTQEIVEHEGGRLSITSETGKSPTIHIEDEENMDDKTSDYQSHEGTDKEASTAEKVDSSESPDHPGNLEMELEPYIPHAVRVSTHHQDPFGNLSRAVKLSALKYGESIKLFYARMLDPTSRVKADVYAYMFMCDFFNFMVVIFGFSAFGTQQGDGGVQAYLEENKVPIPFLVMLILQFGLIIIDRALFLRKFILGKLLFQICLIIGVHIWMFFILPAVTERNFNALLPPPLWYMVKCIYLLLSAYQIRCGYPTRILGNFLCKGYNYVNMFLFKGFMAIPFLFELRALMDWIWTDTSMTLMDWLKMEDIFANVFQLKCSRHVESEFPQPRGEKKKPMVKYLMGGSVLAFIIALIWFPLVLFAFGNTVGESNPPYDVTVKIRMGPYLPIYTMSAQSNNIEVFSEREWDTLVNIYKKDRTAQTFLSNYIYDDLSAVILTGNSTNIWGISPPDIERLQLDAESNDTLNIKFSYIISHKTNSKDNPPIIEEDVDVELKPFTNGVRNPQRQILVDMLKGKTNEWMLIEDMFPKFIKIFNKGEAKPVHQLMNEIKGPSDTMYRHISLRLNHAVNMPGNIMWWEVKEECDDYNYQTFLRHIQYSSCSQLVMYAFSDKLFPATLNFISGSGIIGLYTTFVFLASRVLRGFFADICFKIMFEDLPNVDRVLQLCLDIYLVRESRELSLEEDLFAKLVFLYRSPETMIKWTRPKDEELEEDEAQRRQQ